MPPKTPKKNDSQGEEAQKITILCHLMMSCESFEANTSKLAPILDISHAKNVPRKINNIISPYGFEFKNGKVVKKDEGGAPATPAADTIGENGQDGIATASAKKKVKKASSTPKKRKIDETANDDDDNLDAGEI